MTECILSYTVACDAGRRDSFHRVVDVLLGIGTGCRRAFDAFLLADDSVAFVHFTAAYILLREYVLISVVERSVESIHAIIKRLGNNSPNCSVPYISAAVNEARNLVLLKNRAFYDMCLKWWRSRTLLSTLLAHRFTTLELASMQQQDKIKHLFQCHIASGFTDRRVAIAFKASWQNANPQLRRLKNESLPEEWKQCVSYWKNQFSVRSYYSMPRSIFILNGMRTSSQTSRIQLPFRWRLWSCKPWTSISRPTVTTFSSRS